MTSPTARNTLSAALLCLVLVAPLAAEMPLEPTHQWPQWRGPLATGAAPHSDPPVNWSEEKNIRWKRELPGHGHSTPIVWGQHIFLTAAIAHGDTLEAPPEHDHGAHHNLAADRRMKFVVLAVDKQHGEILWQRTVRDEQPHEGTHETGSWASNSAVTDGRRVYAFFGSRGLHSLDFEGRVRWQKDFGEMRSRHGHGEGASPALHDGTLVINWDHQGESFVVALDAESGEERWRVARDEITSWSTPLVVEHGGKAQVIVAATQRVRAYDLASGKEIWQAAGLSRNVVASPVAADGLVFVGNSYDWQAMLAIRLDKARGDITESDAIVWKRDRDTPYVPSPVLVDDTLCYLKHSHGFLTCVDAATGDRHFGPVRLPNVRNIFASPVAAADRLYITSREGTTAVLRLGREPELLTVNRLDDSFAASPAVVGDSLLLRGAKHLYLISDDPPVTQQDPSPRPSPRTGSGGELRSGIDDSTQ